MGNDYLKLTDTNINIKKAQDLLSIIEAKKKDPNYSKDLQKESGLFNSLFAAFKEFFSNLGKPSMKKRLIKNGSPAYSSDFNQTMTEIYNDVNLAYKEEDSMASMMVKNFNYNEAERQMVLNKVKKLNSDSLDYSLYSKGIQSQSLFASDLFTDKEKLDMGRITAGSTAAEINPSQGVITLKRSGNVDRSPMVKSVTGIKSGLTAWVPETATGGYEGLYWGLKNEPRPEGGVWHLQYSSDGKSLYELGATEEALAPIRMRMFDSNAATFWEVEYVTSTITGYQSKITGAQISVAEFNALFNNEVNSPNVQVQGNTVVTSPNGSLIENYVPVVAGGSFQYLTVNFTVNLQRAESINWISLNPNNFGQEMYMQVISIQTSADGSTFSELEGFDDHEFNNTLTAQANKELTDTTTLATLSPDASKYAGQGLWVFAPRQVAAIRFTIRQTRSYPKAYDVLMVQTSQTITTTVTTEPSDWDAFWGAKPVTNTSTQTITNDVQIPYLVGQISGFDVLDLDPGGSSVSSGTGGADTNAMIAGAAVGTIVGSFIPVVGNIVGNLVGMAVGGILGWIFPGLFSSSSQTSSSVGPQTISKQWTKTLTDKSRFAIGIRDINIFSYKFVATSEIVSKPFISPAPLSKVALNVEEQVPVVFYQGALSGTENDWIKYYISVDDGVSWHRISPLSHKATLSEDGVNLVPQIVNINSEVAPSDRGNPLEYIDTGKAEYEVRFRAALSRPTDITDAESYTPALHSYSLQLYPLGGL